MRSVWAFFGGGLIGILGGLIGLGGAEFRLPLLVSWFRFRILDSIVINLIVSLVTVVFSFIFRTGLIHLDQIIFRTPLIVNILAGSLIGSYFGVRFTTGINEKTLKRTVIALLMGLSLVLIAHDFIYPRQNLQISPLPKAFFAFAAGMVIGTVSSTLGVAGGELIIPTIILLYGIDIKLAGTLSLVISIPTIIVGLMRYKNKQKLVGSLLRSEFIASMSLGSICGALFGSYLLRYAPGSALQIILGVILLLSALHLASRKELGKR